MLFIQIAIASRGKAKRTSDVVKFQTDNFSPVRRQSQEPETEVESRTRTAVTVHRLEPLLLSNGSLPAWKCIRKLHNFLHLHLSSFFFISHRFFFLFKWRSRWSNTFFFWEIADFCETSLRFADRFYYGGLVWEFGDFDRRRLRNWSCTTPAIITLLVVLCFFF